MDAIDPDLELLERWRGGDHRAGEELFRHHFSSIYRFFEHKVGAEADELAQTTFLACLATLERFRGQSSFRTYLFAIARNELYGYLRRVRRDDAVDFEVTSIAEIVRTPASRIDHSRQVAQLRSALRGLPAEQQLILELHYWHDLDAAALGEVLGATAATVRVRLLRARRALWERMERLHPGGLAGANRDRLAASLAGHEGDDLESDRDNE